MPGQNLPADEVDMKNAVAEAIRVVLASVQYMGHVVALPVYPTSAPEDTAQTQVDDPVVGDERKMTNFCEIGIPTVSEEDYSGENCTAFTLTYPISYSLGVVPKWNKDGFPFKSSVEMFDAMYWRARRKFKDTRDLGFKKGVFHYLLQREFVDELTNDEGEAEEHLADWSLSVRVEGNY
jgi:hypothetical protein